MTDFLFSVPSGEPVKIEPFHYAIVGQTQFSGKTTLIKRLADNAITEGYNFDLEILAKISVRNLDISSSKLLQG